MVASDLQSCRGLVYALTGGGGAIGKATALRLAQLGAAGVALADLNVEGMEAGKKDIEDQYPECQVMTTKVDVTSSKQVDEWTDAIMARFGRLDGAGNIAGGSLRKRATDRITDLTDEYWDSVMAVNLSGTMNCMRAQLKVITRPGGAILNCGAGAGMRGLPNFAAYSAAKWGLRGLTKTGAVEFGMEGVRVNILVPGAIFNPEMDALAAGGLIDYAWMNKHSAMGRMGEPHEAAKAAAFLLSPDSSYVTGVELPVDGGAVALHGARNPMPSTMG